MSLCFFVLLPPRSRLSPDQESKPEYAAIPNTDLDEHTTDDLDEDTAPMLDNELPATRLVHLTTADKLRLARPLVFPYMIPLFLVYAAEYIINTVSSGGWPRLDEVLTSKSSRVWLPP